MGPEKHHKVHAPMARPPLKVVVWSVLGAALGIWAIAAFGERFLGTVGGPVMIGAFGASAVLLFGAPNSPLAQPYNLVVGHVMSAFIGVTAYRVVGDANALSMALAVALSIGAMQLTRSVHPPGGATALIAVVGGAPVHALGYMYVLAPVGVGASIMLTVALITNNAKRGNRWPVFWLPVSAHAAPQIEGQAQER